MLVYVYTRETITSLNDEHIHYFQIPKFLCAAWESLPTAPTYPPTADLLSVILN